MCTTSPRLGAVDAYQAKVLSWQRQRYLAVLRAARWRAVPCHRAGCKYAASRRAARAHCRAARWRGTRRPLAAFATAASSERRTTLSTPLAAWHILQGSGLRPEHFQSHVCPPSSRRAVIPLKHVPGPSCPHTQPQASTRPRCLRLATAVAPRTPRRGTSHTSPRRRHSDARVCAPRGGAEPSRAPQAAGAPRRKSQTQTRRRAMGHGALRDALRGRLLARRWVGGAHRRDAVHGLARAAHPRGGACCRPEERSFGASASFRAALAHISGLVFGAHGIAYRSHCQMCPTRRSHNSKIYPRRCGDAAVGWWEVDGSPASVPRGVCAF